MVSMTNDSIPRFDLKFEYDKEAEAWLVTSETLRGLIIEDQILENAMKAAMDLVGPMAYLHEMFDLANLLLSYDQKQEWEKHRQWVINQRRRVMEELRDHNESLVGKLIEESEKAQNSEYRISPELAQTAASVLALMGLPEMYERIKIEQENNSNDMN